jgi:glycosyltransferase involved in cell wall biosynthesis
MKPRSAVDISVVVPALNEAASLERLCEELTEVLDRLECRWEILFIDDGSSDATPECLMRIARLEPRIKAFRLPRNRGKSAAYTVGFSAACGEIIVTMDADLQDDPASLPSLLAALEEGNDLVVGWKQQRFRNEPGKAVPSRAFNWFLRKAFGIALQDSNSGFRAMRASVCRSLRLRGDNYRFLPQMAHHAGFRVCERPVNHRPRLHGQGKYGLSRFFTGLMDALALRFEMSFREKPFQAFGALAVPFFLAGAGLFLYVLAMKLGGSPFLSHVAAMSVGALCMIIGVQILSVGLIGVLLSDVRASGPAPVGRVLQIGGDEHP